MCPNTPGYTMSAWMAGVTPKGSHVNRCQCRRASWAYEALTAADRPYKHGMKLSQAMHIMKKLKADGHIDPDLFDMFLHQGAYLRYAEKFLVPSQRDEFELTT